MTAPMPNMPPPGWLTDPQGVVRWWDGQQWTAAVAPSPGATQGFARPMPVQPNVKQARDRAQYNRQQTGHSIIKHAIFGIFLLYIPTIYYAISPNHYFHA